MKRTLVFLSICAAAWLGAGGAVPADDAPRDAALLQVRQALAGRDLPGLKTALATAGGLKGEPPYDEQLARLELLSQYVEAFWQGVDAGATKALNAGELDVDGTRCAVVDYDRRLFIVRVAGENKRYSLTTIPPKLALVLAQLELPAGNASNQVCFGAFLAMDAKGDRRKAREMWQAAAAKGGDIRGLLAELEIPLAAPPPELPDLTAAQRLSLAPAQWLLRVRDGGKLLREPLGKRGQPSDAGRLTLIADPASDVQLIHKTRLAADFTCRAMFDGVKPGQLFGLFPALPSSEPVVVPLPEGRVQVELQRKKGEYYCRVNERDVELRPAEKTAARLAGYLGISLAPNAACTVALFELSER
jgi:hypothetical protein